MRNEVDFITESGVLKRIACIPYPTKFASQVQIIAAKFQGQIYCYDYLTPEEYEEQCEADANERRKTCSYWGRKFEQYMKSPVNADLKKVPVNANDEFNLVLKNKSGNNGLLYFVESDCNMRKSSALQRKPTDYLELKTTALPTNIYCRESLLRDKFMAWWIQCYIAGIKQIGIAYRNMTGIVQKMEKLTVQEMKQKSYNTLGKHSWNTDVMINFTEKFFDQMKEIVTEDCESCQYVFEWKKGWGEVRVRKVAPDYEIQAIPGWFKKKMASTADVTEAEE